MRRSQSLATALFAVLLAGCFAAQAHAGTIRRLYTFDGFAYPASDLLAGPDGYFYGAAKLDDAVPVYAGGSIYRLSPSGEFKVLYRFPKWNPEGTQVFRGGSPVQSGLTMAADGNLYGISAGFQGGPSLLFSVTPTGVYSVVRDIGSAFGALEG